MTLREQLHDYFKAWTFNRMHQALHIQDIVEEERSACFLCNGFSSKMDMIQKAEQQLMHSTMMDIHHAGVLKGEFSYQTFELYFNAKEPEYTDAEGLAQATDRAQTMLFGFIKDITNDHKRCKKNHIKELPFFFDIENLKWDADGPFGDGWETFTLRLAIIKPFNYCEE